MHIMLYGGAFDPPHNGHLQIAQSVLERQVADQLWFIPCAQHPFGKPMSPATHRLAMLQLLAFAQIKTWELDQPAISYTMETIEHFASLQPDNTFSWLIGSDQLPSFTRWHRWQDLLNHYAIYVYPRQDFPFAHLQPGMIPLKELPLITISSTQVRHHTENGLPIDHLVPKAIAAYITTHHLYVKS